MTLNSVKEYMGAIRNQYLRADREKKGKILDESFFGSYKTEAVYRNEYNSLVEAVTGWESYRDW